jgi:hypothetical protein
MALIVPMPETVRVAAEHVLHGHVSPLGLVAQQDVEAVIEAWEYECG